LCHQKKKTMATKDKTYGNKAQYESAVQFLKNNKEKMLAELGQEIKTYSSKWESDPEQVLPIWTTSFINDVWLYKNCNLDFVQKRLREQWGENCEKLVMFGQMCDFSTPFVHIIWIYSTNDSSVSMVFTYEDEHGDNCVLDETDEIISIGDAYILEVLNFAVQSLTNQKPYFSKFITVEFNYYGATMKFQDGKFYCFMGVDGDYKWTEIKDFWPTTVILEQHLKVPKIEITLDTNKAFKYNREKIFFSDGYKEGGFVDSLSEYNQCMDGMIKRGAFHKSEHLLKFFR
jgi:hypothetical protein